MTPNFESRKRRGPSMRLRHSRRSTAKSLHLLVALAAAFLLLPVAMASAATAPGEIVFAGEGSGWVKGVEPGTTKTGGIPLVECHWNGHEIDVGTSVSEGSHVAELHVCQTNAQEVSGLVGLKVEREAEPGSKFAGWKTLSGTRIALVACHEEDPTATVCGINSFGGQEIKIRATFECEGTPPCPAGGGNPSLKIDSTVGTGSGQVNCEVDGNPTLDEPCEEEYEAGAVVKLIPEAGVHSEFAGFENGTGGAAGCTTSPCGPFTLEEDSGVDARFNLIPHTLTVEPTGEGSVGAEASPAPVSGEISACEETIGECAAEYGEGQTVKLKATPGEHKVVEWTGCTHETGNVCEVEIPAGDTAVQADFADASLGTLTVEPTGEGSVGAEASPAPVSGEISACEQTSGECSATYYQGEVITLVATPGANRETVWTSGCDNVPSADECEVTLYGATVSVEVEFALESKALTITEPGDGTGAVECEVDGGGLEGCPTSAGYGSTIKLVASPAAGSELASVAGTGSASGCTTSGCEFTLEEDSEVTVEFALENSLLAIAETGNGSGSVECEDITEGGGLAPCASSYANGDAVRLVATPDTGSELASVSGAGSASGCTASPCEFTLEEDSEVSIEFKLESSLTIRHSGGGSGSFQCDTGSGPGPCKATYTEGTVLTVIAVPAASSDFAGWSGECATTSGERCEVTLDADRTVEAAFTLKSLALNVGKAGAGTGMVTSSPAGISCGGACSHSYDYGTEVTLSASPGSISDFLGWSGCDEALGDWCKVSLSAARTVTATFTQRTKALTLETIGPGSGSISCNGGPCASRYPEGATVTLHANPDSGATFFGWAGAGCTGGGDCVVTLDRDTTVAASFEVASSEGEGEAEGKPGAGSAVPLANGLLRGKLALVKARCRGAGSCLGKVRLVVRLRIRRVVHRHGRRRVIRRTRKVVIGAGRMRIAAGRAGWVKVHLNRRGLRLAHRAGHRGLVSILAGKGVKNRSVRLRHRHGGRMR